MSNEEVQDHHGTVGFKVICGQQLLHLKPGQEVKTAQLHLTNAVHTHTHCMQIKRSQSS